MLGDLGFFFLGCLDDKSRYEHNSSKRNDHKITSLHAQRLVIEIGQAQAETAVQVVGCATLFDDADHLFSLVASKGSTLVDELSQHAVAFFLVFRISDEIRRQPNRGVQDLDVMD